MKQGILLIIAVFVIFSACSPKNIKISEPEVTELLIQAPNCPLTTQLIKEKCHLQLNEGLSLEVYNNINNANNECWVAASTVRSDPVRVVTVTEFKNKTWSEIVVQGARNLPDVGDQAEISESDKGFSIYLRVGDRLARFSASSINNGEDVLFNDPDTQTVKKIGGACNLEEAIELVQEVLVPYWSR